MKKKSKWSIVEDVFKFPNGGATRDIVSQRQQSGSIYNPIMLPEITVTSTKNIPTIIPKPNFIPVQDATKIEPSLTDKLNFQGIKLNTTPKVNIVNVQKKLNDLKQIQDSIGSLNGGLGSSNFFDMLKQRDKGQEIGNLESKYQDQLPHTPLINKADAVGTTMITLGKYFAPPQLRQGLDYALNAQDVVELYKNPTDTLNQASVASDALSFIKSKKTGFAPFNYAGDIITLKQKYDLFNNASKQTYKNGGRTIPESIQPEYSKNYTGTFLPLNQNPDGSPRKKLYDNNNGNVSTESVIGIDDETGYYNIPTVINGIRFPNNNAIDEFYKNGYHTGYFTNQEDADKSADSRERANIGLASTGLYRNGGKISNWTIID
jgi:hypothetical protein